LDAVVIGARRHVYYFAAHWTDWRHLSTFVLFADGRSTLVSANEPNRAAAADDVRAYVANRTSTLDDAQPRVLGGVVDQILEERGVRRIGLDASTVGSQVAVGFEGELETIDFEIFQLRRVKDADELELMRKAIDCCGAMYARAREIIDPGIAEVEVFAELQAVAVEAAGEPLAGPLGNDYACGVPGGPPRPGRTARAGELYILDLGPVYRGYFSDNARTIAVNGKPTDAQYAASEVVLGCLSVVEREARAGVRCRAIWDAVNAYLAEHGRGPMTHHLGHGVGLNPHEYPHLNPEWDDTLQEGEVFTAEPGLYGPDLAGGIRIENQYLVTRDGLECLTGFPSGLV